jgi:serine/threonine-protein kinase
MSQSQPPDANAPTLDAVPDPANSAAGEQPGKAAAAEAVTLSPSDPAPVVNAGSPARLTAASVPPGYEILEELGRGGMGVVYKARQVNLNRIVALKMILAGAHAGPQEVARFRGEAEAVARLRHPNIVQIYEVGEVEGRPFFSLEFIEGGSLADQLDGTPQPPRRSAQLIHALALAVETAHREGIVHRDLKPANILLQKSEIRNPKSETKSAPVRSSFGFRISDFEAGVSDLEPKVTDFGLAKRLGDASGPTQSGAILGTPSYMSPEQAGGKGKTVGAATDVYALGAILYELLTGRPPFKAATPLDTVLQVVTADPVPPSRLQPKLPRDLETICSKCLQKDARKRYGSAAALADDLQRFLTDEPIQARPIRWWERAAKWARRRPAAAALLAVIALAVVTVFTILAVDQARLARSNAALAAQIEKVEQEQEKTTREHQRAQAHLHKALAAVDEITKVGTQALEDQPQFADLRRRLAETALALHREFLQVESDEPIVRHVTARAYSQTGALNLLLANTAEAQGAYLESIRLLERLTAESPDELAYQYDLSSSHENLGHVFATEGDVGRAVAEYGKALELSDRLVQKDPANAAYQVRVVYNNLWLGYFSLFNSTAAAEARFRECVRIAEYLTQTHPGVAEYQWLLGGGRSCLGWAKVMQRQWADAEPLLGQALATLLPEGTEPAGVDREYYKSLGQTLINQGLVYLRTGRLPEARQSLSAGIAHYERLRSLAPKLFVYRYVLAMAYQYQGELYGRTKEPDLAAETWRKATDTVDQLFQDYPKNSWLRLMVDACRVNELLALARSGEVDQALVRAEELRYRPNLRPEMVYNVACIYAVASGAVASDRQRADDLARQAMNLLERAEKSGFLRDAARLKHARTFDEDLEALRARADFQELMKRAEKQLKADGSSAGREP